VSRFHSGAHGFHCTRRVLYGVPCWIMSWTVDHYYRNSMLRYPRRHTRETEDEKATRRFCKKHNIQFPNEALK
jgi:hypothetical protein